MRSGGCAAQQAATVVRQAVALARRRGHAQVTPLHVASALLSAAAGGGLLRAACLHAHSHPLQCKALDLCFNVALNRLPAGGPAVAAAAVFHGHLGGHQHHHHLQPVLSNALIAAFKRAQAHQRRGAVEGQPPPPPPQQQQQVLASSSKVELGQLVVSILDDPSVSRVMHEAGFSCSQVKANVEKVVASSPEHHSTPTTTTTSPGSGPGHSIRRRLSAKVDDATMRVLDCMAGGSKRCAVVVGENAEGVVKAVMDRVSKGLPKFDTKCEGDTSGIAAISLALADMNTSGSVTCSKSSFSLIVLIHLASSSTSPSADFIDSFPWSY